MMQLVHLILVTTSLWQVSLPSKAVSPCPEWKLMIVLISPTALLPSIVKYVLKRQVLALVQAVSPAIGSPLRNGDTSTGAPQLLPARLPRAVVKGGVRGGASHFIIPFGIWKLKTVLVPQEQQRHRGQQG